MIDQQFIDAPRTQFIVADKFNQPADDRGVQAARFCVWIFPVAISAA